MRPPRLFLLLFLVFVLAFAGCEKVSTVSGGDGEKISPESSGSSVGEGLPDSDMPVKGEGPVIVKGYLKGPGDSSRFKVAAGDIDELRVSFAIPAEPADFWVKITGEDEKTLLDDVKLTKGYDIVLLNGGTFYLNVYSKAGEGNWSATYVLKADDESPETPGLDSDSKCTVMESSAFGSLEGPGESCEIPIEVKELLEVTFTYPKDSADFWVEVTGPGGGTAVGEYNLAENNVVTLNGTGKFKLTIYSNYGSGNWSATW
ncbi:MAG: hypothetical protein JW984_08665 [Deltaproteobacteria bacterium]|uniref:Uncharacterized protein n=1 Tax=Candidatus Zymogenus saltonus TaxID=2844893 RepID=A0A9D8KDU2_9DELT|nr:hypothetical protein [Candidatus Zymogenus saltonus]